MSFESYLADDPDVIIWDLVTGEKLQQISSKLHTAIRSAAWLDDGILESFIVGCTDGTMEIFHCTMQVSGSSVPIGQDSHIIRPSMNTWEVSKACINPP